MPAKPPIQVGIAGLGRSGWQIHADLLKGLPDYFQVAAVVDAEYSRRQEAENVFDCDSYEEFGGLLGNDRVEPRDHFATQFLARRPDCAVTSSRTARSL